MIESKKRNYFALGIEVFTPQRRMSEEYKRKARPEERGKCPKHNSDYKSITPKLLSGTKKDCKNSPLYYLKKTQFEFCFFGHHIFIPRWIES